MKFREKNQFEELDREVERLQRKIQIRSVSEQDRVRMLAIVSDPEYRRYIRDRTRHYNRQVQRYGQIVFDL
jgi:hypothetical protein